MGRVATTNSLKNRLLDSLSDKAALPYPKRRGMIECKECGCTDNESEFSSGCPECGNWDSWELRGDEDVY